MEFIFEHEQLRIDEIAQKISIKNNFTPLKPLRKIDLNRRKSLANDERKIKNFKYYKRGNSEDRSYSPGFKKFFDVGWKEKSILEWKKMNFPKSEESFYGGIGEQKAVRNSALPEIPKKGFFKQEEIRKNIKRPLNSFIAYIPSVTYIKS